MTSNDNNDTDEMVQLQNENAQLNLELCTLHTQCEALELENKGLKEEITNLKEKIKNFEEYIDKIEENDIIENTEVNDIDISASIQEENDVNVLKHKIIDLQKEIIRLSDNLKEDLINNENMQSEYESQIEVLKNDIIALENENDQMRIDVNNIKEKCQIDIKNCYEEITVIKKEKEESEQKFIEKLQELNAIIKKYQLKIYDQEQAYKELCDSSTQKLKETYDKFTEEIKNIKNNQEEFNSIGNSEITLENHNLKTENIEIKNNLEKSQNQLKICQKQLNELIEKQNTFIKFEKSYKNRIKELEEANESLRADILNASISERESGEIKEDNKNEKYIKENMELKKENEKLQKYIISSEFRNAFAMKINFENKKLKEEINVYKKEIEKLNKKNAKILGNKNNNNENSNLINK